LKEVLLKEKEIENRKGKKGNNVKREMVVEEKRWIIRKS
jgi:hypothetical protein